jgi:hypothetical protein
MSVISARIFLKSQNWAPLLVLVCKDNIIPIVGIKDSENRLTVISINGIFFEIPVKVNILNCIFVE